MDPDGHLGAPVRPTLPLSPLPLIYKIFIPYISILGLVGFVYFSLTMVRQSHYPTGGLGLALACLSAAVAGSLGFYRSWTGRWALTLHENGMSFERGSRTRSFLYDGIREIAVHEREQFDEANRHGILRDVTVASASDRLSARFLTLDQDPDTAGPVLAELRARLAEAVGLRLRRGESLAGPGWTLTSGALQTADETVPLEMLSEAMVYDSRVAVWKHGGEIPWLSAPSDSPNALLLLDVLAARLPAQPRRQEGLGRALFEKRAQRSAILAGALVSTLVFVCLPFMIGPGPVRPVLAAFNAVIGVVLALATLQGALTGFRCYEKGVVSFSAFGRRQILFSEVERMSFQVKRLSRKAVYLVTLFKMKLYPREGRPLTLTDRAYQRLSDLEKLQDRLAGMIADRLRDRIAYEGEALWTDGVRISREGVRFTRRRLLGGGEETLAAFSQDLRFAIDRGRFELFVPDDRRPVLTISCDAENFYPGFLLFQRFAFEAKVNPSAASSARL
ncbi:MAG TPA: hypothetical protein VF789_26845 [Thermoanaerobaculia bacterium]